MITGTRSVLNMHLVPAAHGCEPTNSPDAARHYALGLGWQISTLQVFTAGATAVTELMWKWRTREQSTAFEHVITVQKQTGLGLVRALGGDVALGLRQRDSVSPSASCCIPLPFDTPSAPSLLFLFFAPVQPSTFEDFHV